MERRKRKEGGRFANREIKEEDEEEREREGEEEGEKKERGGGGAEWRIYRGSGGGGEKGRVAPLGTGVSLDKKKI